MFRQRNDCFQQNSSSSSSGENRPCQLVPIPSHAVDGVHKSLCAKCVGSPAFDRSRRWVCRHVEGLLKANDAKPRRERLPLQAFSVDPHLHNLVQQQLQKQGEAAEQVPISCVDCCQGPPSPFLPTPSPPRIVPLWNPFVSLPCTMSLLGPC